MQKRKVHIPSVKHILNSLYEINASISIIYLFNKSICNFMHCQFV